MSKKLDPLPAVVGGRDAVGRPVDGEERVPGVVVAVELVRLVVGGEDLVELGDLLGARELVLLAEQPQQRRAEVGQLVDEVRDLEREALRRGAGDERAVAVDRRVEVEVAGGQHRLTAAGAVADHPDLAVRASTASADTRPRHRRRRSAARRERRPAPGRSRPRRRAPRPAPRASRGWGRSRRSRLGEPPHDLLRGAVISGHVVDHHDAAAGPRRRRAR